MSDREKLKTVIDSLPDYQVHYILGIIEGLNAEIPNDATLESFAEMKRGDYKEFDGSTSDIFEQILSEG